MTSATLRHSSQPLRAPVRSKPVARGASRTVVKEPRAARQLVKPDLSGLKRLLWPLLLVGLAVGTYNLAQWALPYADSPISRVDVQNELGHVSQQVIQERVAPYASASFFDVDLAAMRADLEALPWIAQAQIRRVWPDQVVIKLEEQLPIARWGDGALLNNQGEAFVPEQISKYASLPLLQGPQRAQQQVMQQYQMLSQMLRPLGLSIVRLELRERGSWFLSTAQGVELLLGRDHLIEKMQRFVAIYEKTLKPQMASVASIDLRYPNGLAVAWHAPATDAAATPAAVN